MSRTYRRHLEPSRRGQPALTKQNRRTLKSYKQRRPNERIAVRRGA